MRVTAGPADWSRWLVRLAGPAAEGLPAIDCCRVVGLPTESGPSA